MNRILIAALPLLIVTPVLAQGGPHGGWGGSQTKAEAEARAALLFDRLDANHDGFVTQDEVTQAVQAMSAQMGGDTRMSDRISRMFGEADADHDGKVSRDEAKASADHRFDAADLNHDGTVTPEERQAERQQGTGNTPQR